MYLFYANCTCLKVSLNIELYYPLTMNLSLNQPLASLSQIIVIYSLRFVVGLIILLIGVKLINVVVKHLKKTAEARVPDPTLNTFMLSSISIALKIVLMIGVLVIWGVQTTALIAIFGGLSLALGLALQGSMSNVASGVMILLLKPFKVGDYITINTFEGTVQTIELFSTTVTPLDNRTVIIPNSMLTSTVVINYSAQKQRRINLKVEVLYGQDLEKIEEILATVLKGTPNLLQEPSKPSVTLLEQRQNTITYVLRAWVNKEVFGSTRSLLRKSLASELIKHNIKVPAPLNPTNPA